MLVVGEDVLRDPRPYQRPVAPGAAEPVDLIKPGAPVPRTPEVGAAAATTRRAAQADPES